MYEMMTQKVFFLNKKIENLIIGARSFVKSVKATYYGSRNRD